MVTTVIKGKIRKEMVRAKSPVVKKIKPKVHKIIILENKVPLDFILPKDLTVTDRKVYEEKIRQGIPWDHPSIQGDKGR
jgi:hypothetical protein